MQIIEPLVETGEYIEQHERWYLMPLPRYVGAGAILPVDASVAHARFLSKWMQQERREDSRARRDAREQFQARMQEVTA